MASVSSCQLLGNRLVFPGFAHPDIFHGVFTRHQGVSSAPFNSLNVALSLGDSLENVGKNREIIKASLGISVLISARQVHGSGVYNIDYPPETDLEIEGYDALITRCRGVGLMIQHADCQAIFLHDPIQAAVGIIHAGWRGSVANIIDKTVRAMTEFFTTDPADLSAAVGPSMGPCCGEFINYRQELPRQFYQYQVRPTYFNFWNISRDQLLNGGLSSARLWLAKRCTVCDPEYFSYRRDKRTGRCGSVIGLCL